MSDQAMSVVIICVIVAVPVAICLLIQGAVVFAALRAIRAAGIEVIELGHGQPLDAVRVDADDVTATVGASWMRRWGIGVLADYHTFWRRS